VRIPGYFSKPKGAREQNCLENSGPVYCGDKTCTPILASLCNVIDNKDKLWLHRDINLVIFCSFISCYCLSSILRIYWMFWTSDSCESYWPKNVANLWCEKCLRKVLLHILWRRSNILFCFAAFGNLRKNVQSTCLHSDVCCKWR